jgi:N-acetylglutamate synthase-like GNAT family acetyltransferase
MSDVSFNSLLPDEWGRIPAAVWETTRARPVPEHSTLYVAEHQGDVIGCIGAQTVKLVRPFWVARQWRGLGIAEQLARGCNELVPSDMHRLFVTNSRHAELLAINMGFDPLEGIPYLKDG